MILTEGQKRLAPVVNSGIFLICGFVGWTKTLVEWEGVFWESGELGRGFLGPWQIGKRFSRTGEDTDRTRRGFLGWMRPPEGWEEAFPGPMMRFSGMGEDPGVVRRDHLG